MAPARKGLSVMANIAGPDVEPEKAPAAAGDKSSDKGGASSAGEEKKA